MISYIFEKCNLEKNITLCLKNVFFYRYLHRVSIIMNLCLLALIFGQIWKCNFEVKQKWNSARRASLLWSKISNSWVIIVCVQWLSIYTTVIIFLYDKVYDQKKSVNLKKGDCNPKSTHAKHLQEPHFNSLSRNNHLLFIFCLV